MDEAARLVRKEGTQTAKKLLSKKNSPWRFGDTYVFGIKIDSKCPSVETFWLHATEPGMENATSLRCRYWLNLMDVIGVLIEKYEDDHVPELTGI